MQFKNSELQEVLELPDGGGVVWLDPEAGSWVRQTEDDAAAPRIAITVAEALQLASEARGWILEKTHAALIDFDVAANIQRDKAITEAWAEPGSMLDDREWKETTSEFAEAESKFDRLAEQLIGSARRLSP